MTTDARILDQLYDIVDQRHGVDPSESYTARLFDRGRAKIAQKVGEEAVEVVIEVTRKNPSALAEESADLLYHLMVAWSASGVKPEQVWSLLDARMATHGGKDKKKRFAPPGAPLSGTEEGGKS